jgi:hypothetical protein
MGARQKLNQAHLNGALVIAALVGALTHSWPIFVLAALLAAGSSVYGGGIRPRIGDDRFRR